MNWQTGQVKIKRLHERQKLTIFFWNSGSCFAKYLSKLYLIEYLFFPAKNNLGISLKYHIKTNFTNQILSTQKKTQKIPTDQYVSQKE
jgi:hypothetical protein